MVSLDIYNYYSYHFLSKCPERSKQYIRKSRFTWGDDMFQCLSAAQPNEPEPFCNARIATRHRLLGAKLPKSHRHFVGAQRSNVEKYKASKSSFEVRWAIWVIINHHESPWGICMGYRSIRHIWTNNLSLTTQLDPTFADDLFDLSHNKICVFLKESVQKLNIFFDLLNKNIETQQNNPSTYNSRGQGRIVSNFPIMFPVVPLFLPAD